MPDNFKRRFQTPRPRPDWWPQNEAWPPDRAYWRHGRGRLFRRLGCFLGAMLFTVLIVFTMLVILVASAVGLVRISRSFGWLFPLGAVILFAGIFMISWAGRGLRRLTLPLADLVEASERVSAGDYSQKVQERGSQDMRSLVRTFNRMTEHLGESAEQRRIFMADVTHELRTPLAVIQGNIEGMIDGVYPADEEHLKAVLEETQLLDRLVDDLRTLSLAESGALHLKKEPTDLAILIKETREIFQSQANLSGILINVEAQNDTGLIELDGERIQQVLSNLISNALRYTSPGGTIEVRYKVIPNEAERWAQIEVQDTGEGIAVQDLPHVFERFYKGSDSKGMGLGLPIVKTLVEAHGGTISVESQPGQGTTFTILIPTGG
jgi:two-component system sensor histidine kinase BaeS